MNFVEKLEGSVYWMMCKNNFDNIATSRNRRKNSEGAFYNYFVCDPKENEKIHVSQVSVSIEFDAICSMHITVCYISWGQLFFGSNEFYTNNL